jgi:hypothetical protein
VESSRQLAVAARAAVPFVKQVPPPIVVVSRRSSCNRRRPCHRDDQPYNKDAVAFEGSEQWSTSCPLSFHSSIAEPSMGCRLIFELALLLFQHACNSFALIFEQFVSLNDDRAPRLQRSSGAIASINQQQKRRVEANERCHSLRVALHWLEEDTTLLVVAAFD